MKRHITVLAGLFLITATATLTAQFGGGGMAGSPSGPGLGGPMLKLFGEHTSFTANLEFQIRQAGSSDPMIMPGKIAVSDGDSRFEMDLMQAKGNQIPPEALGQLKQMGMEKMLMISLPKKHHSYLIYPGLESYVELPIDDPDAGKTAADYEMTVAEVGREEIAGHACIKNNVVVTDQDGKKHESTVWNAGDLKKFPVKIETTEQGHNIVLLFSDIEFSKPAADRFTPPPAYKKYDNMMAMMQEIMIKRMGAGANGAEK